MASVRATCVHSMCFAFSARKFLLIALRKETFLAEILALLSFLETVAAYMLTMVTIADHWQPLPT